MQRKCNTPVALTMTKRCSNYDEMENLFINDEFKANAITLSKRSREELRIAINNKEQCIDSNSYCQNDIIRTCSLTELKYTLHYYDLLANIPEDWFVISPNVLQSLPMSLADLHENKS